MGKGLGVGDRQFPLTKIFPNLKQLLNLVWVMRRGFGKCCLAQVSSLIPGANHVQSVSWEV